jgi:hypothetical protein
MQNIGTPFNPVFAFSGGFTPWMGPVHFYDMWTSEGDLDGNGYPEMARNLDLTYYINENGAGFSFGNTGTFDIDDTNFNQYPELADLNTDGLTDLIVRHRDSSIWLAYQNTGTFEEPSWQRANTWLQGLSAYSILKVRGANINGDDRMDLIGIDGERHLAGFIGIGSGDNVAFQYVPEIFEDWNDYSITYFDCVDIDGDGDDGILVNNGGQIEFIENRTPVAIVEAKDNLPKVMSLLQNYPNPFNGSTNISFSLDKPGYVSLTVYDILGRKVEIIYEGTLPVGEHTICWTARQGIPTGIYFYKLKSAYSSITKKMILMK